MKLRVSFVQIVQPVIAGGQDEPPGAARPESGLIHFQLDGIQDRLLAHRLHNAAGSQHRKPALDPDVGVECVLCHLFPALDGDGHGKAAGVAGALGFPLQGLGDHLPGHMVDGSFPHRLVQPGLGHPAHALAAGDADLGGIGQQFYGGDHGQAGGHIHIIPAVLLNGAFGSGSGGAAVQRSHLHHDALRRAQGNALRGMAGEQEPRGPRRTQRRAGAGGVPAAEQLLPTANVMFKLWPGRLFRAEHGLVLLLGQAVQRPDVLRGKGLLWGQHPRNAVRKHADHRVRDLLRHVQLVQADDHGQPLLMGQFLQDGQQLDLALDIQKRGRLVQQQNSGLLADGTGQQNALALAVADAVEIPVCQRGSPHQFQRVPHGLPVGIGQDAQPPGIGDAPGGGKLKAGSQLGAAGMGQHQGQLPGPGRAGVIGQAAAIQQDSPAQGGQLARQRFEQSGFARAVWPDEGQDLPRHRPQRDAGSKGRTAIADGQFFRFTAVFHRTPS